MVGVEGAVDREFLDLPALPGPVPDDLAHHRAVPDSTTEVGPLIAATETPSSWPAIDSRASSAEIAIAAMAPPTGICLLTRRTRSAISAAASSSEKIPAAVAAANSPTECPST